MNCGLHLFNQHFFSQHFSCNETYVPAKTYFVIFLCLSLSGKQEEVDATLETLKVVQGRLSHWAAVMVDICAYAGNNKWDKVFKSGLSKSCGRQPLKKFKG